MNVHHLFVTIKFLSYFTSSTQIGLLCKSHSNTLHSGLFIYRYLESVNDCVCGYNAIKMKTLNIPSFSFGSINYLEFELKDKFHPND